MSDELPIYSNTMLRTGLQFAGLDAFRGPDWRDAWTKADALLAEMEGAAEVESVRALATGFNKNELLKAHAHLFQGRTGAGQFRSIALPPLYRGQDCAPPEFIEGSIENLEMWLAADSFKEIHPIERCAITISRIVDIWPFDFGNKSIAILFANRSLSAAGFAPFYILPQHLKEFEQAVVSAMTIEMQPLINAIYQTVRREMMPSGK